MKTTTVDWRKEPPSWAFDMCAENDAAFEPTMWPATDNYNRDRKRMVAALGCDYIEVRMQTVWRVWDPETSEAEWRQDNCECEDGPHYTGPLIKTSTGEAVPPEECATTKPAKALDDFWDEQGIYCPWHSCKPSTPGAVKFRLGKVAA